MEDNDDIRWQQRFEHFQKAFSRLDSAVQLANQRPLSDLEEQGLIQAFEFTHELAWNILRDYLISQGIEPIYGSKDATREAFRVGLITNGEVWMDMIKSRNLTSHTYQDDVAKAIATNIKNVFWVEFSDWEKKMQKLKGGHA